MMFDRLRAWLAAELLHVRGHSIRRLHGVGLVAVLAIAAVVLVAAGVFVGAYVYPYRTVPAPKLPPTLTAPNPSTCKHVMGGCLPQPKSGTPSNSASISATTQGPDLSNNDPVFEPGQAAIARHNAFEIVKVSEGTGFVDSTARPMAHDARSHGLVVGGYDFLHVCLDNPVSEARLYVSALSGDGLTGKGTLPPTGDVEYPSSPQCNVRVWLQGWVGTVQALLHRSVMLYSGEWWWGPHVGAWWLRGALAWVSGYVPWPPPRLAGHSGIDLWQFSDRGWNGATSGDLSVWRDGVKAFQRITGARRIVTVIGGAHHYERFDNHARAFRDPNGHVTRARERSSVQAWDRHQCRQPARRPVCKATLNHLRKLRARLLALHATHPWRYGKPTAIGVRNQQLVHRIIDPHGHLFTTWRSGL